MPLPQDADPVRDQVQPLRQRVPDHLRGRHLLQASQAQLP